MMMRGRLGLAVAVLAAIGGSVGLAAAAVQGQNQVVAPKPFVQLAQAAPTQAQLMTAGTPLYLRNCAPCHGPAGQGGDGPKLAGNAFVAGEGAVISQILNGYEEHGMPPFREVLKDDEIAAIVTFVRNSFGNTGGGATLPAKVAATR